MAVGSNSLGLLFKIGVDASDATGAFQKVKGAVDDLATGLVAGGKQGFKDFFGGVEDGAKRTTDAFKQLITPVNQTVQGLSTITGGNFGAGFTSLARGIGPIGIALGVAAVAAFGAIKAFEQIIDLSDKIGTTSKDDFEEFQKSLAEVGVTLTKTDQIIAQQLNKSFADLRATTDSLFLILLKTTGPALVVLIKEISVLLVNFGPALDIIGRFISANLIQAAAILEVISKFIKALKEDASGAFFNFDFVKEFTDAIAKVKAATTAVSQSPLIPFEPGKVRAAAKEVDEFAKALKDAQKELDKAREKSGDILIQNMEDQLKELNAAVAATFDVKKIADFKFEMIDFAKFMTNVLDGIVQDTARLGREIPGGGKGIPGLPDPDEVQGQLDAIHDSFGGFFEDLKSGFEDSGAVFGSWGDLAIGILKDFAKAGEQAFAAFILTGKLGGQIFKQLVAQIIASVAIESAIKAIFQLAEGFAALAAGNPVAAAEHFTSAKIYGAVAVAAGAVGIGIGASGGLGGGAAGASGGGFGGETAAPTPVTINQGAGGTLGIPANTLLLNSIDQHLSNLTTAPPGDIVTRGAEQNPVAIGQANNEASRRDGSISREFLQISGLRTA